jgi:tetratricopeptide (TPR) repeat protein
VVGFTPMATSRDRLFGMLAVQLGFIDASTLKKHLHRSSQRELALGAWLVKEGVLSHADVALLEACAAQSFKTHGGSAPALTALSRGAQAYTESFGGFDDTVGSGEHPTSSQDSLEGLDFVVPEMPGRYVTTSLPELGRGGLGRVLAIKDQVLGRTVALKELHGDVRSATAEARSSLEQEARFLREARLSAQLEHPSIVPIYEAGRRLDGSLFYTMRRIEGRTLAEALAAARDLDARLKLMPHLIAMAQALAYAHSRDVLHRDLKPQNVMLGRFGETYLLDWGLAKVKVKPQRTSAEALQAPDITGGLRLGALGTPSYMSPEQAAGKHDLVDERTDVWGLGAVLYEALTGRPPYTGTSAIDCIQRILTDDVLPVRELEPGAPGDLVAVCEKALRRRREDRYASAGELAADLQAWLDGRTVSARDYSSVSLLGRVIKRNARTFAAVGALLAALLVSAGFFTWRLDRERREARALSTFVLDVVVEDIAELPGVERLLDRVMRPALAFYRAQGATLSDDERALLGRTLHTTARLASLVARHDEAVRDLDECLTVVPLDGPLAKKDPAARGTALGCAVGLLDEARNQGDVEAERRHRAVLAGVIAAHGQENLDSVRWVSALALAHDRLAFAAQAAGNADETLRLTLAEIALDERASRLAPDDIRLSTNFASTSTRLAMVLFEPNKPDASLEVANKALARLESIPRRFQNTRVLRAWTALLQQHVTNLVWAGRREEARASVEAGKRVFEQLEALEPNDVQGRGVHADYLLALDKPCEARAILDRLYAEGMRGDYFTSWLLAALACGTDAPFIDGAADLAASTDPQAHWLSALWLIEQGRGDDAVVVLRTWKERASGSPLQWPLGVLDGLPSRVPQPQRAAVKQFIEGLEAFIRSEDAPVDPVFDGLVSALAETGRPNGR